MKTFLLACLTLTLATTAANAQKIKFKKGSVFVDDKECLEYDSSSNTVEMNSLDGSQTVLLKFIRTGVGANDGLYTKIVFLEQDKSFTSKSYIFGKKLLVKKLIKDGVLTDCKFNADKIDKFIAKYDEAVEDNLVRY